MIKKAVIAGGNTVLSEKLKSMLTGYETDICSVSGYTAGGDFSVLDLSANKLPENTSADDWDTIEKKYVDAVYSFFKGLFPKIKERNWSSAVVIIPSGGNYVSESAMYLIEGMCKSFACEAAQYNAIINCIECRGMDIKRLSELIVFFADERAYMTGQVLRPCFKNSYVFSGSPVALITGAGQGIGLAAVRELKSRGFKVCLNDIAMTESVKRAAYETGSYPAMGDISVRENTDRFIANIISDLGGIDVFIANAAYMNMCPFEKLEKQDFDRHVNVNIRGHLGCLSAVIPVMKKQGFGRIILFSSMFGTSGWRNACSYAGTKTALIGLGQYLAAELEEYGISVCIISPGVIDTPQLKADADDMGVTVEEVKKIYARDIPLGRVGSPESVAYLAGFLADGGADYLSGSIIQTNGGEIRNTPESISRR